MGCKSSKNSRVQHTHDLRPSGSSQRRTNSFTSIRQARNTSEWDLHSNQDWIEENVHRRHNTHSAAHNLSNYEDPNPRLYTRRGQDAYISDEDDSNLNRFTSSPDEYILTSDEDDAHQDHYEDFGRGDPTLIPRIDFPSSDEDFDRIGRSRSQLTEYSDEDSEEAEEGLGPPGLGRATSTESINSNTVRYRYSQRTNSRRNSADDSDSRDACIVCQNELVLRDDVRRLPCLHVFHSKCIDRWLRRNTRCPICQGDFEALAADSMEAIFP